MIKTISWDAPINQLQTSFAIMGDEHKKFLAISQTGGVGSVILITNDDTKVLLGDREDEMAFLLCRRLREIFFQDQHDMHAHEIMEFPQTIILTLAIKPLDIDTITQILGSFSAKNSPSVL